MDDEALTKEFLQNQIDQLQLERDGLKKDIEQLCMQQAGPSYISIATRMHFQRIAGLEQEIEILKMKLAGSLREKQNLQEELLEAYRIKTQLADLLNAEISKNKEAEQQLKFFQGCVAAAFSERDHSLMEFEKAKDREVIILEKLNISEQRVEELESAYCSVKEHNVTVMNELGELKEQIESFEKVINMFYGIREPDAGVSLNHTWQSKCSCLLDDSIDKWIFNCDSRPTTSIYVSSLEAEIDSLKQAMEKLQSNLRMGLQVEQHLKKSAQYHKTRQMQLIESFDSSLLSLRHKFDEQRADIVKILEEENFYLKELLLKVNEKLYRAQLEIVLKHESFPEEAEHLFNESECRDVYVTDNVDVSLRTMEPDILSSVISSRMDSTSDTLSQALQEKVAALLLLSQQEERHLLERETNAALQKKMEELRRSLSQVTNEKIEALMELAQLKREYELLQDKDVTKNDNLSSDREGTLANILKKRSFKYWVGKKCGAHDTNVKVCNEYNLTAKENDFARLKVENATLQESISNTERITSSVHPLHAWLIKANADAANLNSSECLESFNSIFAEANQVKTALCSSIPLNLFADPTLDALTHESLCETASSSSGQRCDQVVNRAGLEMVLLLILALQLFKEKIALNTNTCS